MVDWSRFKLVLTGLLVIAAVSTGVAHAKTNASADSLATISVAELPAQGAQTYALIAQGGPFPHDKDGVVFGNRERLLPTAKRCSMVVLANFIFLRMSLVWFLRRQGSRLGGVVIDHVVRRVDL